MYKINTGLEMIITDEVLVRFKPKSEKIKQTELLKKFGLIILKTTDTYLLLKVPKGVDVLDVANQYQESGLVEFAQPNFIVEIEKHQQVIPNDPYFANQFTLNNTGQVFNDGHFGTADADIDGPEAWALTAGGNILVAVLDEGVSPNHPDLPNARQVRLNGSNFADGDPNDPSPTGNMNHGNSCAGVIAATQNNNEGIAGICPNCRIMPIRIFNANGTGIPSNRLADAIDFARTNGAAIISNSWGFNSSNPNFQPVIVTAIQNATTQGRGDLGCVVLFSASNSARQNQGDIGQIGFPRNVNIPGVITVGASERNDLQSDYSPTSNLGSGNNQVIDIVAPSHRAYPPTAYPAGVVGGIVGETFEAWSIDIPANAGYNPWPQFTAGTTASVNPPAIGEQLPNVGVNFQAYTGRFGGTSHSCPVVAGVAALMLSANPNLTQQQIFDIITGNADRVGGYVYTNGRSNELGFGRVNACRAVLEAYRIGNVVNGAALVCSSNPYALQNSPNANRISWSTSNSAGVTIDANGLATRVNNFIGQVTITATIGGACGNVSFTRVVNVGNYPPVGSSSVNSNCSGNSFNVLNTSLSGICSANTAVYFTFNITDPNYSNCVFTPVSLPSGASWSGGGRTLNVTVYTPPSSGSRTATFALSATGPCGPYNVNFNASAVNISSGGWRFSMSPNPSDGQVTVSADSESLLEKDSPNLIHAIKVTDPSGTRSESFEYKGGITSTTISLKDRQPGLYILSIFDGKTWSSKQLLIQK
jgi:subtilisin family serine protease